MSSSVSSSFDPLAFDWGHADLKPEAVQLALSQSEEPPSLREGRPVEHLIHLKDGARAWACHEVLHDWRLAHAHQDEALDARSLMLGRMVSAGWLDLVRSDLIRFMSHLPAGSSGPFHHALDALRQPDTAEAYALRQILTHSRLRPVVDHVGAHGVAEGWEMIQWWGRTSAFLVGHQDHLQFKARSSSPQKALKKAWLAWTGPVDPENLNPSLVALAQRLGQAWEGAAMTQAEPTQEMRHAAIAWTEGWGNLGEELLSYLKIESALFRAVPTLAHGFGLLRQGLLPGAAVEDLLFTIHNLSSCQDTEEAEALFRWNALPLPHQLSEVKHQKDVLRQWTDVLDEHPAWVFDRPLPRQWVADHVSSDPELQAHWRAAAHHEVPERKLPRLRHRS